MKTKNNPPGDENISIVFLGKHKTPHLKLKTIPYGYCQVCEEEKEIKSHHVIPRRAKTQTRVLQNLRLMVCEECDKIIHAENQELDGFDIIKRQAKTIKTQYEELKAKYDIFIILIDERIKDLAEACGELPEKLKATPRKIYPAQTKVEGRIKELKKFRGIVHKKMNIKRRC